MDSILQITFFISSSNTKKMFLLSHLPPIALKYQSWIFYCGPFTGPNGVSVHIRRHQTNHYHSSRVLTSNMATTMSTNGRWCCSSWWWWWWWWLMIMKRRVIIFQRIYQHCSNKWSTFPGENIHIFIDLSLLHNSHITRALWRLRPVATRLLVLKLVQPNNRKKHSNAELLVF